MTADKLLASGDDQLLRALDLVTRQSKQERQSTIFPFQWPEAGRWEKVDY